jgi:3-hydroxyacyl-[acyl-carrier-protein] dehydratase
MQRAIAASAVGPASVDGAGKVSRPFLFEPGFPGFGGHFPGAPILPAVVQIQAVVALASDAAGEPLRLAAVESAKFLSPIRPGEAVVASFRRCESGGATLHDAAIAAGGRTASSFLLRLVPAGGPS